MKIAIPSRNNMVDEHFGHCEYFTVFTVGSDKTVESQETFTPPPSCGCKSNLVEILGQMGVTVLVAGNMGEGAVMKLRQGGIEVVRGAKGPIDQALGAWLNGSLKDADILCQAHGDGHQCGNHG